MTIIAKGEPKKVKTLFGGEKKSAFVEMVDEGKKVRAQKRKRKKRWLFLGGGGVLAGIATAAIIYLSGSDPAVRLPDPPTFPTEQ